LPTPKVRIEDTQTHPAELMEIAAKIVAEPPTHENRMLRYDSAFMIGIFEGDKAPKAALDVLLEFLKDDGIPWNNNNAENAIKLFASRRKVMGTLFTGRGIKDYLLLLSLYQTLRYRGLGFWKFLLSGETDLAAYAAKCR